MRKQFLSILLCAVLLVSAICACGSAEGSAPSGAPAAEMSASEVSAPEPEQTEAPAAEPAEEMTSVEPEEASSAEELPAEPESVQADPFDALKEPFISYPLEGDNNTISYWYFMEQESRNDAWITPYAEEATGVHVDYVEVPRASVYEQFNLMIASGDMPDLIPCSYYYSGGLSKAYEEDIILNSG